MRIFKCLHYLGYYLKLMYNRCGFVAEVCLVLESGPSDRQYLLWVGREDPEWGLKDYQREFIIERLDFRNFAAISPPFVAPLYLAGT